MSKSTCSWTSEETVDVQESKGYVLKEINIVVEQCKRINIVLWADVKIKALPC